MFSANIPPKFNIPWGSSAGSANIRAIPTASQISTQAGAASLTDGFPPLNMIPISAGGVPPFGQDMNGILNQITKWEQWQAAGGSVTFDSTFSAAVGGYPRGAVLLSSLGHALYISTSENNAVNPDVSLTGWKVIANVWGENLWSATGSANAQLLTLSPVPTSLTQLQGVKLNIISNGVNTGAVSLNVNGLGAFAIQTPGGLQLAGGALVTSYPYEVTYNNGTFILSSHTTVFNDPAGTGGATIVGLSPQGANLALLGNGVLTPNKFVRAQNGQFQVVNNAYNSAILTLTDTGTLGITGAAAVGAGITSQNGYTAATGDIVAASGRMRAAVGAINSGLPTAIPILSDFSLSFTDINRGYNQLPNGMIEQTQATTVPGNGTGLLSTLVTLPITFPTNILDAIISFLGTTPPANVGISVQPFDAGRVQVTTNTTGIGASGSYGVVIRSKGF